MKKSKPGRRKKQEKRGIWLYLTVLVVSFGVSAGGSYLYLQEQIVFESSVMADIESRHNVSSRKEKDNGSLRLYEARNNEQVVKDGTVFRKDASLVVVEDIIRKNVKDYGVQLLDLYFDRAGTVYIDFSGEIKKKFSGDATEELNVIAGLFKGIKAEIPGLKALKILIEGREAESFGGHIDISKPIGREIAETI